MTVVARLQTELGSIVSVDDAELEASRTDKSGWTADGAPLAVVRAVTVEHVQAVLRIASEYRAPVITRGAGTGLAGGACTCSTVTARTTASGATSAVQPDL